MIIDVVAERGAALTSAVEAIRDGECIVVPTDTVYGIGADALNHAAVRRLLEAKRRGRDLPPPVLLAEPAMLRSVAHDISAEALALADAFWPGALTLVVRAHPSLGMDLGDRQGTIAVRVPDHDFTRDLLRVSGPLAVSSANINGRRPATTITEAVEQLGESVTVYLDAGPAREALASTIVDATGAEPTILRAGAISAEVLAGVVPALAEV